MNTLITVLQVFGIGFSFGIAGPCFFFCTPILAAYVIGRRDRFVDTLADLVIFLTGRLAAYVILGALAGLSGGLIRRILESRAGAYLGPLGGIVSILLGISVLIYKEPAACECGRGRKAAYGRAGLFVLGFIIGVSPCPPLAALLVEIALISKSIFEGAGYALAFGLGTFISGLLVIGALAGIFKGAAARLVRSKTGNDAFRIVCAALLVLFGSWLIFRSLFMR